MSRHYDKAELSIDQKVSCCEDMIDEIIENLKGLHVMLSTIREIPDEPTEKTD